jgi:hypothetical protein
MSYSGVSQRFAKFLALTHLAIVCWVISSGNSRGENEQSGSGSARNLQDPPKTNATPGKWEKLVMLPFRDEQGTLLVEMPFPSTWQLATNIKQGEPTVIGPNGIKIIDFPAQFFTYTSDPRMQQTYRAAGQPLRAMPGVEQIVQQDIAPWAATQGLKLVRHYEIPEISRVDRWYNDQMFKTVPTQVRVQAIGIDWVTPKEDHYFMVMHLTVGDSAVLQTWYYNCSGLQAQKAHFEAAKKHLIFGLANARYNLKPILAYNQKEAEKAGKSWAAHNERMARNQANFEATQRAFVNRSTAAHDTLMSKWNERNAAGDKAHEQFVDTITERTKVVEPSSDNRYKVESGYNHYWMNSDGKYLSTDKQDYDPNLDKSLSHQKWQELKKTD